MEPTSCKFKSFGSSKCIENPRKPRRIKKHFWSTLYNKNRFNGVKNKRGAKREPLANQTKSFQWFDFCIKCINRMNLKSSIDCWKTCVMRRYNFLLRNFLIQPKRIKISRFRMVLFRYKLQISSLRKFNQKSNQLSIIIYKWIIFVKYIFSRFVVCIQSKNKKLEGGALFFRKCAFFRTNTYAFTEPLGTFWPPPVYPYSTKSQSESRTYALRTCSASSRLW